MADKVFAEEPRRPIERLRRFRLWQIADAYGIPYPKDAAKDTMVQILEGSGVDVTQPLPNGNKVPWKEVPVQTESGQMATQMYPDEPEAGGLGEADLSRILEEREQQKRKAEETAEENSALQEQMQRMLDMNKKLLDRVNALEQQLSEPEQAPAPALEQADEAAPDTDSSDDAQQKTGLDDGVPLDLTGGQKGLKRYHTLRRMCHDHGIATPNGTTANQMEDQLLRTLNGHAP